MLPPVRRLNFEKQLVKGEIEPFANVRIGRSDLLREWPEREVRAMISLEFPQTEWVLLEEAINFVTYGACFSRRKHTLADLNAEPKRSGSLFENVPDLERHRFIIDFANGASPPWLSRKAPDAK